MALPAKPTAPISPSLQTEGSVGIDCTVREIVVLFVKLPDVPVTVTVTVPVAAVPLAVSVNVLVLVALVGLNDAVTPVGRPDADKFTLLLKPFCAVTVMLLVLVVPCDIVKLFGEAERAKFGGGFTVRETVALLVKLPDVPVTVSVTVPVVAVLLAVKVSVLLLAVLPGLNEAVTPLGRPDADKLTLPLKPFSGVMVMLLVPVAPCTIVTLLGDAEREKVGCGATAAVTDTLSKVAVAKAEVVRLLTASPTYTFGAMLTVWLAPNCSQFAPSAELYMVNTFPLLASLIQ